MASFLVICKNKGNWKKYIICLRFSSMHYILCMLDHNINVNFSYILMYINLLTSELIINKTQLDKTGIRFPDVMSNVSEGSEHVLTFLELPKQDSKAQNGISF